VADFFRRRTYTRRPLTGDYILGRTGVSWSVNRSLGEGTVARLTEGQQDKQSAFGMVVRAARADATDAWETAGAGEFRLLESWRVAEGPRKT
jgi:hypothetical protein